MAAPLISEQQVRAPAPGGFQIAPIGLPDFGRESSPVGRAVAQLGETGMQLATKMMNARQQTDVARAKTTYIEGSASDQKELTESQDFKTAPAEFGSRDDRRQAEILSQITNPQEKAELKLWMTQHRISAQNKVDTAAHGKEVDLNRASLNARGVDYFHRMATAGSDTERQAGLKAWGDDVDRQVAAGYVSQVEGQKIKESAAQSLAQRDVMELMRTDPHGLKAKLLNPEQWKHLPPVMRQTMLEQSQTAIDRRVQADLRQRANYDPAGAVATAGRVTSRDGADHVFQKGVIWQESRGNPRAISPAGALGIAQVLPGTARQVARQLGMNDIANLSEYDLDQRLLNDAPLNARLGQEYFRQGIERYNGSVPAALARYNAGPGTREKLRADFWHADATARFGPNYTAEQFASIVTVKETRDYIRSIYRHLGADLGAHGASYDGRYAIQTGVETVVAADNAAAMAAAKQLAESARLTDNPALMMQDGFTPDPEKYAGWKLTQRNAANAGDKAAAKALEEAEFRELMLPMVRQIQAAPPHQAEALLNQLKATLRNDPRADYQTKRRIDALDAAYDTTRQMAAKDPVSLREQAGGLAPTAIDTRAPVSDPGFLMSLAQRGAVFGQAAEFYGVDAKFFKPAELAALKNRWEQAGAVERMRLIEAFGTAFGNPRDNPQAQRTFEIAIGEMGGSTVSQFAAGQFALGRGDLARKILEGEEMMRGEKVSDKSSEVRRALEQTVAGQMFDPPTQSRLVDAALALYTRERGGSALYSATDSAGIAKAIEEITGPIANRNGRKVPAPPGMTTSRMAEVLDTLPAAGLNRFSGGAYDGNGREMNGADVARRAWLTPLFPGGSEYLVKMPDGKDGAVVFNVEGRPLVIDMKQLDRVHRTAVAAPGAGLLAPRGFAGEAEAPTPTPRSTRAGFGGASEQARALPSSEAAGFAYFRPDEPEIAREARFAHQYMLDEMNTLDRQMRALEGSGLGGAFREAQTKRLAARKTELEQKYSREVSEVMRNQAADDARAQIDREEAALEGSGLGGAFYAENKRRLKERRDAISGGFTPYDVP